MSKNKRAKRPNNHLAEGEATGHFHDAVGAGVAVYDYADGSVLLTAPCGAQVTHQEHGTVAVPPSRGGYDVSRVVEYDHFAEEARVVAD